jgi:tetratricopeptide (TPR) repeat protein
MSTAIISFILASKNATVEFNCSRIIRLNESTRGDRVWREILILSLFALIGSRAWALGGTPEHVIAAKIDQGGNAGAAANRAAADAQTRLAQNPSDQAATAQLNRAQETRRAADQYRDQAAAQYPDSFDVQKAAAGAAVKEEDWQGALQYGKASVNLAGDDPVKLPGALRNLSLAQLKTGDYPAAAEAAKRALELKPSDPKLAGELMALYQNSKGRTKAGNPVSGTGATGGVAGGPAAEAKTTAPMTAPAARAPMVFNTAGADRLKANELVAQAGGGLGMDRTRAIAFLDKALQLDPNNSAGLHLKAKIAVMDGDLQGALENLNRAIEADPKNLSAYRERAVVRTALKQQQDQIETDFLASGGARSDFAAFYADAAKRTSASRGEGPGTGRSDAAAGGGAAQDFFWNRLARREATNADWLKLAGLLAAAGLGYAGMRAVWRRKAG